MLNLGKHMRIYNKFIIFKRIKIKKKLQLYYYLIIQDRINEALDIFNRIKEEEIEDNIHNKRYKIQYDYIYAYLDFTFSYPEFKIAKSLCIFRYYIYEILLFHLNLNIFKIKNGLC